ncbi:uncharacterized protein LOC122062625 isoform X2 [Macadamia integrifolia]|uniref:uncharacterized protein LOC122062625 isoform X2 n=1 Tax=Macadamia integrifolia TaxID=60698 RepID=UPI001C4FB392|nr:uncharacterized protein LOC122062625 isoform X2 [Macadamia integrifolia]
MPVKRTRVARSSSLGEIGFFSQVRPIDAPTSMWEKNAAPSAAIKRPVQKFSKPSYVKPEKSCRKILTIASPVRDSSVENLEFCSDAKVGRFLEACYLCKKKLGESDEVFMYSCKCRDQQMALDREMEKFAGDSTENAVLRHWEQNLKGCFGGQKPQIEKDMAS